MSGLQVSVVIPTYRRPALLNNALAAFAAQDLPRAAFEVIVVDDEPSLENRAVVEAATDAHPGLELRYLPVERNGGPARARNLGIRAARAPIVALTDDDCEPAPGWLSAGLLAFGPGIDGVAGRVLSRDGKTLGGTFSGGNVFYRRATLEAVSGYDERYHLTWREDSDIFFRLIEHGCRFAAAPDAIVYHPNRPDGWSETFAQGRRAFNDPLLHKNFPHLFRQYIEPRPPYGYYAATALALATPMLALARKRPAATASAAVWALMTLALATRRRRLPAAQGPLTTLMTSALYPPLLAYYRLRGAIHWRHPFI